MTAVGHQDQFVPTSQSVGCAFGQETFAGMQCDGEEAPLPDPPAITLDRGGSTYSGHSRIRSDRAGREQRAGPCYSRYHLVGGRSEEVRK